MASLDLSATFDVANVELFLKRLEIIGLPGDLISLIRNCFLQDVSVCMCWQQQFMHSPIWGRASPRLYFRGNSLCNLCLSIVWPCKANTICRWQLYHYMEQEPSSVDHQHAAFAWNDHKVVKTFGRRDQWLQDWSLLVLWKDHPHI